MTDEEFVRSRFPDVQCMRCGECNCWHIRSAERRTLFRGVGSNLGDGYDSETEAWQDAAKFIRSDAFFATPEEMFKKDAEDSQT